MRITDNLVDSVGGWWQQLAEGWQSLRERTGRAITRFTDADGDAQRPVTSWGLLPVDIQESDRSLTVRLEMPGLDRSDIQLEVYRDRLLVRGEKRVERRSREAGYHLHECAYGSFQRLIPLPVAVDEQAVEARYKRGVLTVELSKKPEAGRRRIEVR